MNRRLSFAILVGAFAALALTPLKLGVSDPFLITPAEGTAPEMPTTAFRRDAVFPDTDSHAVPAGIARYGSWIGGPQFSGQHDTPWYQRRGQLTIMVAGYPASPPNQLALELKLRDGGTRTVPYEAPNPGETWEPWHIDLGSDVAAFRIRAVDGSTQSNGWLAFTEPFAMRYPVGRQLWAIAQIALALCLALTLLWGPGLAWVLRRPQRSTDGDLALAMLVGPMALAFIGGSSWVLGGIIPPVATARIGIAVMLVAIAYSCRKKHASGKLSREAGVTITAAVLVVGFAAAKANVSLGPAGELYGGTVSRTLAVGGHSDSRICYHVVQLVAHHFAPFSREATGYFAPWSFASRGPLGGLIAAPVVLATGADVPLGMPDQLWEPFDRQGFVVYRITMIALASLSVWAVFGLVATIVSPAWGMGAGAITLLSPFFVHELYFTWPKLIAAGCVLAAFLLALRHRWLRAGLLLGVGYLFHPLALLSAPFLALWSIGEQSDSTKRWTRLRALLAITVGALLLVAPWQGFATAFGVSQAVFVNYPRMADNAWATFSSWWLTRWHNAANTFIPLYLLSGNLEHESLNSVYVPSGFWVRASFVYWNTLPFALGLPTFCLLALKIGSAIRRSPWVALTVFVGPALLLIAYWGAADTGLMRHCGHVLFLTCIALGLWSVARDSNSTPGVGRVLLHPLLFGYRIIDIGVMAFGTTLINGLARGSGVFFFNDLVSIALATTSLLGAGVILVRGAKDISAARLDASGRMAPKAGGTKGFSST